jgi:hypothetical protein
MLQLLKKLRPSLLQAQRVELLRKINKIVSV